MKTVKSGQLNMSLGLKYIRECKMAKIEESTSIDNITFLLDYCSKVPELYNEVANHLWEIFSIKSAELVLLITYYVNEERKRK